MKRRHTLLLLALAAALPVAQAQTGKWPEKTVRIVVPAQPGGAAGIIGAEIVARAKPDGYTLAIVPATFAISGALHKLPYDPIKDIAPISMISTGPIILAVHPSVKAANLKEFIKLACAKPGTLNFGSNGARMASTPPCILWPSSSCR